ncbi:hypothetical protein HHK36_021782 [Tetracentron sinense]|uniref:Uncharacterized protein n=1 Tax=Tetracentron sinense TaxID=13715 RepID=A0A835D7P5_TETSI|nr:hypothetical protein HHK36_021782 [Tetracentron sinense]
MATTSCGETEFDDCRDDSAALQLKMIGIAAILTAGVAGIAIPLVGKKRSFLRTDGNLFFAAKAFAAGVILATGFVHMLPGGSSALSDPCLPKTPWSKFPFSGFIAMMASLATLVVEFVGTQYYERKLERRRASDELGRDGSLDTVSSMGIVPAERVQEKDRNGNVFGEEEGGGMHILGIHAHAAHHRHSHPHGQKACDGHVSSHSHSHSHSHSRGFADGDKEGGIRHVVVSQILELGIVSHSAQFKTLSTTLMACFFVITTPAGIGIGTGLSLFYNPDSPRALVVEGILDSVSAGILVYMALVDLIAADFLSKRMSCNVRLQVVSYIALFLGAGLMSSLAIWV